MSLENNDSYSAYVAAEAQAVAFKDAKKLWGQLRAKYPRELMLELEESEFSSSCESRQEWEQRRDAKCHNFESIVFPSLMSEKLQPDSNMFICRFNECRRAKRSFVGRNTLVRHLIQFHYDDIPGGGLFLLQNPASFDRFMCKLCDGHFKIHSQYKCHKAECKLIVSSFLQARTSSSLADGAIGQSERVVEKKALSARNLRESMQLKWSDEWHAQESSTQAAVAWELSTLSAMDSGHASSPSHFGIYSDEADADSSYDSKVNTRKRHLSSSSWSSSSTCTVEQALVLVNEASQPAKRSKAAYPLCVMSAGSDDEDLELLGCLASVEDEVACSSKAKDELNGRNASAKKRSHLSSSEGGLTTTKRAKCGAFSTDVCFVIENQVEKEDNMELLRYLAMHPEY